MLIIQCFQLTRRKNPDLVVISITDTNFPVMFCLFYLVLILYNQLVRYSVQCYSSPRLQSTQFLVSLSYLIQFHGRLIYKAMDEPYKTYFPHTFGLKSLEFLFRLYLIVVRAASLPYPFTIIGLLCKYSVSDRSLAFQKQFRPRLGVCSSSRRFNFVVSPSSLSQSSMQSPAQLRQIRSISLSLFTFQSMCWASEAFTR